MNTKGKKTKDEARYIQIPLPMIRLLIKDKRNISDILSYGVYISAMSQKCTIENAALQLLYVFHNQDSKKECAKIPDSILEELRELDEIVGLTDEDYRGFIGRDGTFCPQDLGGNMATDAIIDYFNERPSFRDEVIEFHLIRQFCKLLKLSIRDITAFRRVHNRYRQYDHCDIFAYASLDILFRYYNNIKEQTEDDMARLIMYLADKSIMGNAKVKRTNKEMILARMVGARSPIEIAEPLQDDDIRAFYDKYSTRTVFSRIQAEVERYKFIGRIYSHPKMRRSGTFLSNDPDMTDEEFVREVYDIVAAEKARRNREKVARFREKTRIDNSKLDKMMETLLEIERIGARKAEPAPEMPKMPEINEEEIPF